MFVQCFALIMFSWISVSQAAETVEFYQGSRAMAMGGASVATVNDETALLLNPSGLGRIRNFFGTLIDPEIEASHRNLIVYANKSIPKIFDPTDVAASLATTTDESYHLKAQLFPSIVVRNFGLGLLYKDVMSAYINKAGDQIDYYYYRDLAVVLGYNLNFWGGRFKLGLTAKGIDRVQASGSQAPNANFDFETNAVGGWGIGYDVGLTMTSPTKWLPALAIVHNDVGNTSLSSGPSRSQETSSRPAAIPQDITAGFSVSPIHSKNLRSVWTIEYPHILTQAGNFDYQTSLRYGVEFNYQDVFYLRVGAFNGYWTAGYEFQTENLQFQLATYAAELGTSNSARASRRIMGKASFRF